MLVNLSAKISIMLLILAAIIVGTFFYYSPEIATQEFVAGAIAGFSVSMLIVVLTASENLISSSKAVLILSVILAILLVTYFSLP